jgi:hypothetical protein
MTRHEECIESPQESLFLNAEKMEANGTVVECSFSLGLFSSFGTFGRDKRRRFGLSCPIFAEKRGGHGEELIMQDNSEITGDHFSRSDTKCSVHMSQAEGGDGLYGPIQLNPNFRLTQT